MFDDIAGLLVKHLIVKDIVVEGFQYRLVIVFNALHSFLSRLFGVFHQTVVLRVHIKPDQDLKIQVRVCLQTLNQFADAGEIKETHQKLQLLTRLDQCGKPGF